MPAKTLTHITIFKTIASEYDALLHMGDGSVRTERVGALSQERAYVILRDKYPAVMLKRAEGSRR